MKDLPLMHYIVLAGFLAVPIFIGFVMTTANKYRDDWTDAVPGEWVGPWTKLDQKLYGFATPEEYLADKYDMSVADYLRMIEQRREERDRVLLLKHDPVEEEATSEDGM